MKKFFFLILLFFYSSNLNADINIVFIDMKFIINNSELGKHYNKILKKKEDNINHHTIKVRIKSKNSDKIENNSDSNEYNSVINEIGEDGTKKIERPGSPRDRW